MKSDHDALLQFVNVRLFVAILKFVLVSMVMIIGRQSDDKAW